MRAHALLVEVTARQRDGVIIRDKRSRYLFEREGGPSLRIDQHTRILRLGTGHDICNDAVGLALALPVFALEMGSHVFDIGHLVGARTSNWIQMVQATPVQRWCQPEEIARLIVYLLSDDASYINGAAYLIDGGASLS